MSMAIKRGIVFASLFSVVCLVVWFIYGARLQQSEGNRPIVLLDKFEKQGVPDFESRTLDGRTFHLNDLRGKIVILNFWATWCPPCVTEFPSMISLSKEFSKDIVLVTVSADERKADVLDFLKAFGGNIINSFHMWDPQRNIISQYGSEKLPETFIIDRSGRLIRKIVSSQDWQDQRIKDYFSNLVSQ